jgi:hypothetical protein
MVQPTPSAKTAFRRLPPVQGADPEGQQWVDPFAAPFGYDRYLRAADGWSRSKPDIEDRRGGRGSWRENPRPSERDGVTVPSHRAFRPRFKCIDIPRWFGALAAHLRRNEAETEQFLHERTRSPSTIGIVR